MGDPETTCGRCGVDIPPDGRHSQHVRIDTHDHYFDCVSGLPRVSCFALVLCGPCSIPVCQTLQTMQQQDQSPQQCGPELGRVAMRLTRKPRTKPRRRDRRGFGVGIVTQAQGLPIGLLPNRYRNEIKALHFAGACNQSLITKHANFRFVAVDLSK